MTVNKIDIVRALAHFEKLTTAEAKIFVDIFFDEMFGALARGENVEIRGFASFRVKEQRGYLGRNPRTGAPLQIAAKRKVKFSPSKRVALRVAPCSAVQVTP
jgi:integration host factor subunit beta